MATRINLDDPLDNHSSRVYGDYDIGRLPYAALVEPSTMMFGNVVPNEESGMKTGTVKNIGIRPLPIKQVLGVGDYLVSTDCPAVLAPGQTCRVTAIFKPLREGPASGGIYIDTGDAAGIEFIHLTGTGGNAANPADWDHRADVDLMLNSLWGFIQRSIGPALTGNAPLLSLPNTTIEFKDEVTVNEESETLTFKISNAGNQELVLDNLQVTGDFELLP